jgi:hypothetical protein
LFFGGKIDRQLARREFGMPWNPNYCSGLGWSSANETSGKVGEFKTLPIQVFGIFMFFTRFMCFIQL